MTITNPKTPQELEAELWTRINAGEMTPDENLKPFRIIDIYLLNQMVSHIYKISKIFV